MHPHFDDALTSFLAGAPGLAGQGTEALPNEARDAVRQAVRDAIRGAREGANQAVTVQSTAPQATIDALRGQIEAEKTAIDKLTAQLTGTTSNAAERAITSQIEQSQERLTSLQSQLDHALGVATVTPEIALPPVLPNDMIPQKAVDITYAFFATVALIAIGAPIARAFARRMDRRGQAMAAAPSSLEPRLDRIEQAIEAIAIEVERVLEGQRFTNKVIGELRALPAPNPLEQWPRQEGKEALPAKRQGDA